MIPDRKPLMTGPEKIEFINMVRKEKQSFETIEETFGRIKRDTHQHTIMHLSDVDEIMKAIKPTETENATQ